MEQSRIKTQLSGVGGLIAIVLVVGLLIGMYQKAFTSVTMIEVQAPRAGLQLDKGASVRVFGGTVGEVRDVKLHEDGARITIALDQDEVASIPAGVTASIRSTTLFGAKFVQLDAPRTPVTEPIREGDVLQASMTGPEVNDVFQQAIGLLDEIDVQKLNTTLTNTAQALEGRGEKIGGLIDTGDAYLRAIQPHLAQLGDDFAATAEVARGYHAVMPQALKMVDQLTTTTTVLSEEQDGFRSILTGIPETADTVETLFSNLEAPLNRFTASMLPVSGLVREFSPSIPCVLNVLVQHVEKVGPVFDNYGPFISGSVSFLPGVYPYEYPENLPKFVSGLGPQCYRIATTENPGFEHIAFDDGTQDIYDDSSRIVDVNLGSPVTVYSDFVKQILGTRAADSFAQMQAQRDAQGDAP